MLGVDQPKPGAAGPVTITLAYYDVQLKRELEELIKIGTLRADARQQIALSMFDKMFPNFTVGNETAALKDEPQRVLPAPKGVCPECGSVSIDPIKPGEWRCIECGVEWNDQNPARERKQ